MKTITLEFPKNDAAFTVLSDLEDVFLDRYLDLKDRSLDHKAAKLYNSLRETVEKILDEWEE